MIVPALVFLGLTQKEASGTSLAALLLPVGIFGVWAYAQRHEVHFDYALGIALGLATGAFAGAQIAGLISNSLLERMFGLLLLLIALKFLLSPAS